MFFCWMSLYSVCFQFVWVLPFSGDFRTLFRCFSNSGALFSNFSIVHGCDFTVFLWLRSLFCSLVLLRCWAWLWEEKVMFMLCILWLRSLFYSLPLFGSYFWVWEIKMILLYPCLGLAERSWALTWGWLFFVWFLKFGVNAFLYVCRLFC